MGTFEDAVTTKESINNELDEIRLIIKTLHQEDIISEENFNLIMRRRQRANMALMRLLNVVKSLCAVIEELPEDTSIMHLPLGYGVSIINEDGTVTEVPENRSADN